MADLNQQGNDLLTWKPTTLSDVSAKPEELSSFNKPKDQLLFKMLKGMQNGRDTILQKHDSKDIPGLVESGNINLFDRPKVKNPDGSVSTVRSMSFEVDGKQVLVPTVSDLGYIMSNDAAIKTYFQTGKHLGVFDSVEAADSYAERLHQEQAELYGLK